MPGIRLTEGPVSPRMSARLLLTTSLICLSHAALVPGVAWSQSWLDNIDQSDGTIDPGTGSWAADDAIWSDADGANHAPLNPGATGILITPAAPVVLTIDGEVQPGALVIEGDGYTVTGGRIADSGSGLELNVADGASVDIDSELAGNLTLTGGGTVAYAGESRALNRVRIDTDTTLNSSGTTSGTVTNVGSFALSGAHEGYVDNRSEMAVTGGTVDGNLSNRGTLTLTDGRVTGYLVNREDATLTDSRVEGAARNSGNLTLTDSAIAGDISNNGDLVLKNGTVGGHITNRRTITGAGSVGGLTNDGTVTVAEGDTLASSARVTNNATLSVAGTLTGAVRNLGEVDLTGTINGYVDNRSEMAVTGGTVDGNLANRGNLALTGSRVTGYLVNREDATLTDSRVEGAASNSGNLTLTDSTIAGDMSNSGDLVLENGTIGGRLDNRGTLTGAGSVGGLTNDGTVTVAEGDTLTSGTRVQNNAALSVAGTLMGAVRNLGEVDLTGTIDGYVDNRSEMTVAGGTVDGNLSNRGTLALTNGRVTGYLVNREDATLTDSRVEGAASNSGNLTLTDSTIAGDMSNSGDLVLENGNVGGQVTNRGTLTGAGSVGGLTNDGTVTVAEGDTLASGIRVQNYATLSVGGTLTGGLRNLGAFDLTGTVEGNVDNRSEMTGTGGTVDGNVSNRGNLALTDGRVTGNLVNSGDARLTDSTVEGAASNSGDVSLTNSTIAGNMSNNGNLVLENGTVGGRITNRGTITGSGSVGRLTNEGTVTVADGDRLTSGAIVQNNANLSVAGTLAANVRNEGVFGLTGLVTGNVNNRNTMSVTGGTVDGNVSNTGNLALNRGEVTGTVNSAGELTLSNSTIGDDVANTGDLTLNRSTVNGAVNNTNNLTMDRSTITGAVSNSGTLAGSGSVGGLTNDGTATVEAGHTLISGTTVQNNAELSVAGRLVADVLNEGAFDLSGNLSGNVDNRNNMSVTGGSVNGDVTNAGELALTDGSITGTVNNAGELALTNSNIRSDVTNTATLTMETGTLNGTVTNAGNLTMGRQSTIRGTVNNSNTLTMENSTVRGTVNNTNNFTMANSTVTGAVNNTNSFTMENGTVNGAVTNSGTLTGSGSVGGLTNDGTVTVAAGDTLTSRTRVQNNAALSVAGTLAANVTNAGDLTLNGTLNGAVQNQQAMTLDGGTVTRVLTNSGTLSGSGSVGGLTNDGTVTVAAGDRLTSAARVTNNAALSVAGMLTGALRNQGEFDLTGTVEGNVDNRNRMTVAGGTVAGGVTNTGDLALSNGRVTGNLVNRQDATLTESRVDGAVTNAGALTLADSAVAGNLTNTGGLALENGTVGGRLDNRGTLTGAGSVGGLVNDGTVTVAEGDTLASGTAVQNNATLVVAGTLDSAVENQRAMSLEGGTVTQTVANRGTLSGSGAVGGLTNDATVTVAEGNRLTSATAVQNNADLAVDGVLVADLANAGRLDLTGRLQGNAQNSDTITIAGGTLTGSLANSGAVVNDGVIRGDVTNTGSYTQSGRLDGSLTTSGNADLSGLFGGDVNFTGGTLNMADGLAIDGAFNIGADLALATGRTLRTNSATIADNVTMTLGGNLHGAIGNDGVIRIEGDTAQITGALRNDGLIRLSGGTTGNTLVVQGDATTGNDAVSGRGAYELDVNLNSLTADGVVLRDAALTGHVNLSLNYLAQDSAALGVGRVTLVDVDNSLGNLNNFTYSAPVLPVGSERIVYAFEQRGNYGDLSLNAAVNSAYGALSGNLVLTQSLIGGVINRPTSPFVVDLAFDDEEKPCGSGFWTRATGGRADSTGATDNGNGFVESEISATYRGIQFGGDFACFDGRHGGWNIALGMLGGINDGQTRQSVHAVDPNDPGRLLDTVSSVNRAEFRQYYGGIYATASKDAFTADLQYRRERTDFTVTNTAAYAGGGLGFDAVDFTSDGHTLSGSVSYMVPLGESGWQIVPTIGFAYSTISGSSLRFDDGYRLDLESSRREVGFLSGTLSRTVVFEGDDAAVNLFATGTYYKDFASPTASTFWREGDASFEPQRLVSDNLGAYGELSLGANYVRIMNAGHTGRPRQFISSARLDMRTGDSLDSLGVTAQVRWQF